MNFDVPTYKIIKTYSSSCCFCEKFLVRLFIENLWRVFCPLSIAGFKRVQKNGFRDSLAAWSNGIHNLRLKRLELMGREIESRQCMHMYIGW
jgi:hypothetical protein